VRTRTSQTDSGFTLIELLAVLALLAVVVTAFVTGSGRGVEAARFRALMTETVAAIGESRTLAIRNAREEVFVVDLKQRRMGRDGGKSVSIPADVDIKATVAASNDTEHGAATLTFFPTGSSTGGTLLFRRGGQAYEIRVNWLTGHAALTRV
jgi:general secretion pathway protein H